MHKKFEVNWTKIKGGCQSERKAAEMNSYSKMPLLKMNKCKVMYHYYWFCDFYKCTAVNNEHF